MTTRTILLLLFGAIVAVLLGVVAFRTDPVPVDLAEVVRAPMRVTVDVEGKTRISEIYEVASPIRGTTRRAPVRVGDRVVAGETVVAIVEPAASDPLDPRSRIQAEAAVREAEANLYVMRSTLRQANEELELAESEYRRAKELVDRGVASLTRLENAEKQLHVREAALQVAISNLERAKSALDRARAALIEPDEGISDPEDCCLEITAPVDGIVLEVDVISERPVFAGTRLLSIGQPEDLEIVADVLSTDAVRLKVGDRAIVERWGGPVPLEARISKIEPMGHTKVSALGIEEQRVDVVLDIVTPVEQRASLGHGFAVFLRIVEWEKDDVLQVPVSALFRRGNDWAVFVAENGVARLRKVDIGRVSDLQAEVIDGLSEGEKVIAHPGERIGDGVRISANGDPGAETQLKQN